MRGLTFGLAALLTLVPVNSAQALDRDNARGGGHSRHSDHNGTFVNPPVRCDFRDGGYGHRGDGRGRGGSNMCISDGGWGWYGGEWALYNNRSWESDSYNDWWHDRPDRAFPRWVQNNQACDRIWWSGGGWRC